MKSYHARLTCLILLFIAIAAVPSVLLGQAQGPLAEAREALQSGDPQKAINLLENLRRSDPSNGQACNLLGIAYDRIGNEAQSLAMFKEFARLAPNTPQAYNNLGAAYLRLGDEEQAEAAFRRAVKLSPHDVGALYNLGAALNAGHKYAQAKPVLEQAFQKERSVAIAYELSMATAGIGDRKGALRILNSMSPPQGQNAAPWLKLIGTLNLSEGNISAALPALEKAIALTPDDQEVAKALTMAFLKANQPDRALALLERQFSDLPASLRHLREGTLMASFQHYTEARTLFEQAATEDPSSYDAFYNLAVLSLENFQDTQRALDSAQQARSIKDTGEIHDLLGDIYESRRQFDSALNNYQEAVRLDPSNDKFVYDLGAELILHENYEAAQTIYRAGLKQFPNSARIWLGLGTAEFMDGKTADSIDAFLKAVDLDPAFEPGYLFLGEASRFYEGRTAEVLTKLAYAARERPQSFGAQYYYGATLVSQMSADEDLTKADEALTALERAATLNPKDARVYYQLGELFRLENKTTEAISNYQKSISLDPNFAEPLYKLGQVYVRAGRQQDAQEMFARHKEVLAKEQADMDRRFSEIRSFVLQMKNPQ